MIFLLYGVLSAPVQSCAGMWPTHYNLTHLHLDELLEVYENTITKYGPNSEIISLQFSKLLSGTWDVIMWKTATECVYSFNLLCIDFVELENEQWKLFACMQTIDTYGNICPDSYNKIHTGSGHLNVVYTDKIQNNYEFIKDIMILEDKTAHFISRNKSNVFFRNNHCGNYSDTYYADEQFHFRFRESSNLDVWTRYCPIKTIYDIKIKS